MAQQTPELVAHEIQGVARRVGYALFARGRKDLALDVELRGSVFVGDRRTVGERENFVFDQQTHTFLSS